MNQMIIFFIDEKHLLQVYHLNQAMMLVCTFYDTVKTCIEARKLWNKLPQEGLVYHFHFLI